MLLLLSSHADDDRPAAHIVGVDLHIAATLCGGECAMAISRIEVRVQGPIRLIDVHRKILPIVIT